MPLRAADVTPKGSSERLRVLRCPTSGCTVMHLRAQVEIEKGQACVETVCKKCKARVLWALDSEGRIRYSIIEEGRR